MIRHPFKVGLKGRKKQNPTVLYICRFEADRHAFHHFLFKLINDLFKRLNIACKLNVILNKGINGYSEGFLKSRDNNLQLLLGRNGKDNFLFLYLPRRLTYIAGMVAYPFKISDGVKQAGYRMGLSVGKLLRGNSRTR